MRRYLLIVSAAALCTALMVNVSRADGWIPEWMGGKKTESTRVKKTSKPTHASGKTSGNALTNLFTPSKSKTVSKWPSKPTNVNRPKKKPAKGESTWLGKIFNTDEPPPPKTTNEWMGLKQIKP